MKTSVVYIYPTYSTFIKKDIDFLSKKYIVKTPKHNWGNKKLIFLNFFQQFVFLSRNILSCQAVFVMFGGYWSFLPTVFGKLFNKPVYIILGGTDCVSFPSLNYGSLRKPLMKIFIKWSYKLCEKLVPVDKSLVYSDYCYYEKSHYKHQGFKFFFPRISTSYKVIHNGFDPIYFNTDIEEKIPNSFVTVASISDMKRFKLKGIDLVVQLAGIYKNCSFTVIGISENVIAQLDSIPNNVTFFPPLSSNQFKQYLFNSEFVLHLSISEGFPNSLCEAMLCRCIPIGSSVGAIPHIIKDTGYLISSSNMEFIKDEFYKIVNSTRTNRLELASKARDRVIENFHISKREKSFMELIDSGN
ncbi:MAG TPA: glycosyltransferase [Ignavibacteria bacterium]|nr:glycosyltransferase [Ignavibacteria bacterium]